MDSSVPLKQHDPTDLWIDLFRKETKNPFFDLRIQSLIFLEKRILRLFSLALGITRGVPINQISTSTFVSKSLILMTSSSADAGDLFQVNFQTGHCERVLPNDSES